MHQGNYSDYDISVGQFRGYVSPIVAVLGLIGNLIVILVFSRENQRSRFSIYSICLAVSSGITLITNTVFDDFLGRGLFYITNHTHYYKLDSTSEFWCKVVEYVSNAMYFSTSYIIVIFSLDRLLTVHRPLALNSIHHLRWALTACMLIYAIAFVANSPLLVVQSLSNDPVSRTNFTCRMAEDEPVAKFYITFEVVCTFTIPFCLVLILNSLIFFRLWQLKHERRKLLPSDRIGNQLEMSRVAGHLALSTAFLLLYMPMVCLVLIRLNLTLIHMDRHSPYAREIIDLSRLFSSIKDITYAINFPLYITFLPNFRHRFIQMFCVCCIPQTSRLWSRAIPGKHRVRIRQLRRLDNMK